LPMLVAESASHTFGDSGFCLDCIILIIMINLGDV
jgi:hypothetical protein